MERQQIVLSALLLTSLLATAGAHAASTGPLAPSGLDSAVTDMGSFNTFASFGTLILPFVLGFTQDITASYLPGWMILSALLLLVSILTVLLESHQVEDRKVHA